jgi:acid phosphatase type 7
VTDSRRRLRVVLLVTCAAAVLGIAAVLAESAKPPAVTSFDAGPSVAGVRVAAAGDIACDPADPNFAEGFGSAAECQQQATSDLLVGAGYAAVLVLGDIQYEFGAPGAFEASYDASWGRVKSSTRPVPGNHEYGTAGAAGYFEYFGSAAGDPAKGYYSFEVGDWHVVALNSICAEVGGCDAGSAQERWLRADLAASTARCTLAYWHHPRYSSGLHGSDATYAAFWQALFDADADLVLVGHDHGYERFAPQDAKGGLDLARGLREFVVGTGGRSLRTFRRVSPNSEARDATTFGVLELSLGPSAYEWRFRAAVGSYSDSGSASCH